MDLSALPVPRLVVVTIDDPSAFDVSALVESVRREIRGGSVDDHAAWIDRLRAMANSMVLPGLAVLALVLVALVLSVVFATRAAMAGNRQIIEVLHFCGAEDHFIAHEFQRHFLLLGIKGGAVGGGLAMAVFLAGTWLFRDSNGLPGRGQLEILAGGFSVGAVGYGGVVGPDRRGGGTHGRHVAARGAAGRWRRSNERGGPPTAGSGTRVRGKGGRGPLPPARRNLIQ